MDPTGNFIITGTHTYAAPSNNNQPWPVTTTITDVGGATTTATGTAQVLVPGRWRTTRRSNDPQQAFLQTYGEATADLNTGGLRLGHPLDFDQSPGTSVGGDPALVYNSATVAVQPHVQVRLASNPANPAPIQIQARLTWNGGTPQDWTTLLMGGIQSGEIYHVTLPVNAPVQTSGLYGWHVEVRATLADNSIRIASGDGTLPVVVRDDSPYGAGWGLASVDSLVIGSTYVLYVTGAGDSRVFAAQGDGVHYTSPPEDFGQLVQNSDHTFTYTTKDQTRIQFDTAGRQTAVVDTHGLALCTSTLEARTNWPR